MSWHLPAVIARIVVVDQILWPQIELEVWTVVKVHTDRIEVRHHQDCSVRVLQLDLAIPRARENARTVRADEVAIRQCGVLPEELFRERNRIFVAANPRQIDASPALTVDTDGIRHMEVRSVSVELSAERVRIQVDVISGYQEPIIEQRTIALAVQLLHVVSGLECGQNVSALLHEEEPLVLVDPPRSIATGDTERADHRQNSLFTSERDCVQTDARISVVHVTRRNIRARVDILREDIADHIFRLGHVDP